MKSAFVASLIALSTLLAAGAPARAAVLRVPTQYAAFNNAVLAAAPGDTIQIAGNGGATFPSVNVQIDKDLTLQGGWRIDFTTRDPGLFVSVLRDTSGTRTRPVLRIFGSVSVRIDGVELVGGQSGIIAEGGANLTLIDTVIRDQVHPRTGDPAIEEIGTGLRMVGGTLVAQRTTFRNNRSDYGGAAAGLIGVSSATFTDCVFDGALSSATAPDDKSGAGIHARDVPALHVTGCVFNRCIAVHRGGGIYALRSVPVVTDCDFVDGYGAGGGGGAYLDDCTSATFVNCRFEGNDAATGGAIHGADSDLVAVTGCTLSRNLALNNAGAIQWIRTGFAISGTAFEANHVGSEIADRGGAVYSLESNGTVAGSSFRNEQALGVGGAWSQIGGTTSFTDTRFENCVSGSFGGALQIEQSGVVELMRCLVADCAAVFGGGVAASFTADILANHCTFAAGRARSEGAAVYVDTGSKVELRNSILCCAAAGDQIYCENAEIVVDHTNAWNDDAVNPRGEYGGECPDPTGQNGNLRVDPMHCDGDPDYALASGSPCEGAASDGGDIGWRGVECTDAAPTGLEPSSWGRLKASYR